MNITKQENIFPVRTSQPANNIYLFQRVCYIYITIRQIIQSNTKDVYVFILHALLYEMKELRNILILKIDKNNI